MFNNLNKFNHTNQTGFKHRGAFKQHSVQE